MATPDTIIFAVQSALRLGDAARQAYVDSTRTRGLVLPLPDFNPSVSASTAFIYFRERSDYRPPGLLAVLERLAVTPTDAAQRDKDEMSVLTFHNEALLTSPSTVTQSLDDGTFLTNESVAHLVAIRQWQRGATGEVTPLQRVAGTILEIAVDYYAHTPGALNDKSPQGKAMRSLLTAIDEISFSTTPIHDLPELFVVATIESLAANPDVLGGNSDTQELIKITASALVIDVKRRFDEIRNEPLFPDGDSVRERRIIDWAEVVFRSVLSSGGRLVVQDPKKYLGVDDTGTGALVNHVGLATLEFVLSQPEGEIDRVFGKEGLDIVVKAALTAVGEHPEILSDTDNEGLKNMLSEVATQLSGLDTLVAPGTLPEVTRIILEKTGQNLPLIWPDMDDPKRHLLISATSETLKIITKQNIEANWNPKFGKQQLLGVVEHVLDEFVQNPGWLVDATGQQSDTLKIVVESVVGVLQKAGDKRLTPETGIAILQTSLHAVSRHKKFLNQVDGGQLAIAALIDTALTKIFDTTLDSVVTWNMVRHEILTGLVDKALDAAGAATDSNGITVISQAHVDAFSNSLDSEFANLISGKPFHYDGLLAAVESAIANA